MDDSFLWLLDNLCFVIAPGGYIKCQKRINGHRFSSFLHHLIIGKPLYGFEVDHKNGDKLDNRVSNLHIVSRGYNNANKKRNGKRKYPGITKWGNKYRLYIRSKYIGMFNTEYEAFQEYLRVSELYYGKPLYFYKEYKQMLEEAGCE